MGGVDYDALCYRFSSTIVCDIYIQHWFIFAAAGSSS